MKKAWIIVLAFFTNLAHLQSQTHKSWLNYSFSQRVTGIDFYGEDIWISTQGGLVKYNAKNCNKTYYNRANSNLPDNNLLNVSCDINGKVWVSGKYYGIGRFNGEKCEIYNQSNSRLPFDQYNTIVKTDKNGCVWISSFRWIAKFDGQNWKTWITGSDLSAFPLISSFDIDANGVVWIYSTDGIGKIENERYTVVSTIGSGLTTKNGCIKIDKKQNVWVAIENIGLYKYNGTTFTQYSKSNSCLPSNNIYAISFDSKNTMWLATAEGLVKFDNSNCRLYQPTPTDTALLCLKPGNNDTIWCGSFSGKLLCFDGHNFTSIDLSNSPLKDNYVSDILNDEDNNTWIGTKKNIAKKTDNQFYSVYNKKANSFIRDKEGAIWIAFDSGDTCLLKINSDKSIVLDSSNSPFNTNIITTRKLAIDNNNQLWVSSDNKGLFKFDGTSFTNYNTSNSAIPSNSITQILVDNKNNIWGGSANGLFKFDGITWTIWNRTNSKIPTNIVTSLTFDSENKLWFSCMDERRLVGIEYGGGLTSFDGQTMTTYTMNNSGLQANTIFDIYIDNKDIIWIATYGAGLMCFDKTDKWSSFNVTNSGIANNIVQVISQDKSGNLWLGHIDAGISIFNPDSFQSSIDKIDDNNRPFVVFPNPVKDDLYVGFKTYNKENIRAQIYNLEGKLVCTFPDQIINRDSSLIHYRLKNSLDHKQVYILKISSDTKQLCAKFIYDKRE